MTTMSDRKALAQRATGPLATEHDVREGIPSGTPFYGLTADHSAILPIRTAIELETREWAGFWVGDTLAHGCTCGHCEPSCRYALYRPCCGACMADNADEAEQ